MTTMACSNNFASSDKLTNTLSGDASWLHATLSRCLLLTSCMLLLLVAPESKARPHISDTLAKGSEWNLNVDGTTGLLKLLGGSGSLTADGGWDMQMDVDWDGRPGTLTAASNASNGIQQVSMRLTHANGIPVELDGFVARETDKMMAGTTRNGVVRGAWYAILADDEPHRSDSDTAEKDTPPTRVPGGPKITAKSSPKSPTSKQKVRFSASTEGPAKVHAVTITVNGKMAKSCRASSCSFVGGPYPKGKVTWSVAARDINNRRSETGNKTLTIKAPAPRRTTPTARCDISGRATGSQKSMASIFTVFLQSSDGSRNMTAKFDSSGNYRFSKVPAGTYRMSADSKADTFVSPHPAQRNITCTGQSIKNQNFEFR